MPPRAWSLACELATLANAVEAARVLADTVSGPADTILPPNVMGETLAGALALVAMRMRDLGRVVRGEPDPALLRAPHNAIEPEAVDGASDVIFHAWSPKRRAGHARKELARADADIARARR